MIQQQKHGRPLVQEARRIVAVYGPTGLYRGLVRCVGYFECKMAFVFAEGMHCLMQCLRRPCLLTPLQWMILMLAMANCEACIPATPCAVRQGRVWGLSQRRRPSCCRPGIDCAA